MCSLMPNCLVFYNYLKLKPYDFSVIILSFLFQFPEILRDVIRCYHFCPTYALMNSSVLSRIFNSMLINIILLGIFSNDIKIRGMHLIREIAFIMLGAALWQGTYLNDMYNLNDLPEKRSDPVVLYIAYLECVILIIFILNIVLFWKQKFDVHQSIDSIPKSSDSLESDDYPTVSKYPIENDVDPWLQFVDNINPFLNINNSSFVMRVFMVIVRFKVSPTLYPHEGPFMSNASFIPYIYAFSISLPFSCSLPSLCPWCAWIVPCVAGARYCSP